MSLWMFVHFLKQRVYLFLQKNINKWKIPAKSVQLPTAKTQAVLVKLYQLETYSSASLLTKLVSKLA